MLLKLAYRHIGINKNLFVIILLVLLSCSTSNYVIHSFDSFLTNEIAYSKTTNLSVKIPKDWFCVEDNEYNRIDLWLIKNDFKAMISFTQLHLSETVFSKIKDDELQKAIFYSKMFIRMKFGETFNHFFNEETFSFQPKADKPLAFNYISFAAYQYIDNENRNSRVVVFKFKNKFFECTAVPNGIDDLNYLFKIQNAVLCTLN